MKFHCCLLYDIIVAVDNLYMPFNDDYAKAGLLNFLLLSCYLSLTPFSYAQISTREEQHTPLPKQIVKNCEECETLPYLQASILACQFHGFW